MTSHCIRRRGGDQPLHMDANVEINTRFKPCSHRELKSLKYYFIEFRNRGIFYEAVTNQILDDLVAACHPRRMTVIGDFSVRGGIKTVVTATYSAP